MWREKRKVRIFGKGKCKLIAKCEFLARESELIARKWWRHFSLSLSPHAPHAQYRKRFRASYFLFSMGKWTVEPCTRSLILISALRSVVVPFERIGTTRTTFLATEVYGECQRSANFWATVMTIWEMRNKSAHLGQGKVWTHRQFQLDIVDVTSVVISLSLSLSLSPSAPDHAQYTKRFCAS